jgi:serine protease Do
MRKRVLSATRLLVILLFGLGLCLSSTAAVQAQGKDKDKDKDSRDIQKSGPKVLAAFRDVVAKPSQYTVRVLCDGKEALLGTIVEADGWILTKASELKGKVTCRLKDGRELDAKIVGVQEPFDLAMLKIEARDLPVVEWRESRNAPVGNWVASPGLGDEPVAVGVVSVAARTVKVPPGAVLDPSKSGYLGIRMEPTDGGVKIVEVEANNPAAKAGIKVNDIIVSVDGKPIPDAEAMINTITSYKPGDTVTVRVKRGDEELDLKATLIKRPPAAARADFQNRMGSELSNRRTGFPTFLQHDQVIKPTDCGGPLVDLDGKAIGINIARAGRVESYAIPSEALLPLMNDLKSGKLAPRDTTAFEEKVAQARAALEKAEAEKAAVEKKVAEARAALEKAEAELKAAKMPPEERKPHDKK